MEHMVEWTITVKCFTVDNYISKACCAVLSNGNVTFYTTLRGPTIAISVNTGTKK